VEIGNNRKVAVTAFWSVEMLCKTRWELNINNIQSIHTQMIPHFLELMESVDSIRVKSGFKLIPGQPQFLLDLIWIPPDLATCIPIPLMHTGSTLTVPDLILIMPCLPHN
jgi:hypothetical protein